MASREQSIQTIISKYGKYLPAEKVQQLKTALQNAGSNFTAISNTIGSSALDNELIQGKTGGAGMQKMRSAVDNIISQVGPKRPQGGARSRPTGNAGVSHRPPSAPKPAPTPKGGAIVRSPGGNLASSRPVSSGKGGAIVPSPGGQMTPPKGKGFGLNLIRDGAISAGLFLAEKLAQSMGTKGAAKGSLLGGDAPVYQTPLNNITAEEEAADSTRTNTDRLMGRGGEQSTPPLPQKDIRGSKTPGSAEPAETNAGEGKAMDAADEHRPGAGYPEGVVRPEDYPTNPGEVQPSRTTDDSSGSGGSETRTSATGVTQKGLTLGGINKLYSSLSKADQMVAGDLPSASKYLSNALPVSVKTEQTQFELVDRDPVSGELRDTKVDFTKGGKFTQPDSTETVSTPRTVPTPAKPGLRPTNVDFNKGGEFTVPDSTETISVPRTMPGTTGGNPADPQDGASPKPDRVERLSQLPVFQGVNGTEFGGEEPDDSSLVSPMYANAERNKARAAFLDPNNKGYSAIRARDRAVGAFDQNGTGVVNIDGELRQFNDGMSADARFALSGGLNSNEEATAFLNKYVKTKVAPADNQGTASEQTDTTLTPGDAPAPVADPQPSRAPSSNGRTNFTVEQSQIPSSNASKAEWDKYFKSLEGGELTRMP